MLRFDLFEFLERSLRGLVDSLRSIFVTIALLFRHPVRGPRVAERRFRDENRRQIGGLTLLFLAFFFSLSIPSPDEFSPLEWAERARRLLATGFNFQWSTVWPALAGALISTVLADLSLRVWLKLNSALGVEQRKIATETAEYALFIPAIMLALWFLSIGIAISDLLYTWANWTIVGISSLLLYGAILTATKVLKGSLEGLGARTVWWSSPGAVAITAMFLTVSYWAGALSADSMRVRAELIMVNNTAIMDFVTDARCSGYPKDPNIYVMMTNWSDRAIFVDLSNTIDAVMAVRRTTDGQNELIIGHQTWLSQDGPPVVLEPGRSAVVAAQLPVTELDSKDDLFADRYLGRRPGSRHGIDEVFFPIVGSRCYVIRRHDSTDGLLTITRPRRPNQSHAIGRDSVVRYQDGRVVEPSKDYPDWW